MRIRLLWLGQKCRRSHLDNGLINTLVLKSTAHSNFHTLSHLSTVQHTAQAHFLLQEYLVTNTIVRIFTVSLLRGRGWVEGNR